MLPVLRLFPVFLTSLLAAALLLVGCGEQASADGEEPPATTPGRSRVETYTLQPQPFEAIIQSTGTVEALYDATLSAQASGTVTSLKELGTFVEEGELVAQLDPTEAQAAVEQAQAQVASARAQLELARDRYQRREPLYRDSIISAQEFEQVRSQLAQAEAGLEQAKATLAQAQKRLANTRVEAPFPGTVEEHFVNVGEQVSPGQQIARVVNTQRVKVVAGVPERYANDIEPGTPVRLNFTSYGEARQDTATVTFVGSTIDPDSRTFPIEVELRNPEGTLKSEMVTQLFISREIIEDALVVPRTAIVRDESGTSVYVVSQTDTSAVARKRDVVLGPASGGHVVIRSGLEADDEVVVSGQNALSPGEPVEIVQRHERLEAIGGAAGS